MACKSTKSPWRSVFTPQMTRQNKYSQLGMPMNKLKVDKLKLFNPRQTFPSLKFDKGVAQWLIQDCPRRVPILKGSQTYYLTNFFSENCMKRKIFRLRGAHVLPRSANGTRVFHDRQI